MSGDKRAYLKLDVGYLTNPKVCAILETSPMAVILHIESIAYATQHLTDGLVPAALVRRLVGASTDDEALLIQAGLWQETPAAGVIEVHDYLEHQRSAADVKRLSAAGAKGAHGRWTDADRIPDGNADRNADGNGLPNAKANGQRERERERKEGAQKRAPETPLPPTWKPKTRHDEYANTHGLSLSSEVLRFRNHALANDRRQRQWDATFANWLAKAVEYKPQTKPIRDPRLGEAFR